MSLISIMASLELIQNWLDWRYIIPHIGVTGGSIHCHRGSTSRPLQLTLIDIHHRTDDWLPGCSINRFLIAATVQGRGNLNFQDVLFLSSHNMLIAQIKIFYGRFLKDKLFASGHWKGMTLSLKHSI